MTRTNELLEEWALVSKQAFNVHHALRVGDEMAVHIQQLQGELNTQKALVQQLDKPAQVPEGWRNAPIESTEEMCSAAHKHFEGWLSESDASQIWDVMLATAPQPCAKGDKHAE